MKLNYGELNDLALFNWLLVEERVDFTIMKLVLNRLNKKNMQEKLQLKTEKEKLPSHENSITLMHKDHNFKSICPEEANKFPNDSTYSFSWPSLMRQNDSVTCCLFFKGHN